MLLQGCLLMTLRRKFGGATLEWTKIASLFLF